MITSSEGNLPQELCELIIRQISARRTILQCCLVSRAFCSTSQPILFSSIDLVDPNLASRRTTYLDWTLSNSPHLANFIHSASLPVVCKSQSQMNRVADLIQDLDHLRSLTLVGDPKYPKSPPSKVIINSLRANWAATFLHLTSLHLKDIHNFRFSIVRSPNLQTLTLRNVFCSDVRAGSVFPSTFNRLQELSLDSSVKRHLESNSSLFAFMKYNNCLLEHLSFRNLGGTIREDVTGSFLEAIPSFKVDALRSLCIPAPSTANPSRNPNVTLLLPIYSNLETFGLYVSVYWTGTPYLRGALKWLECEMVHVAISHPLHRISLHIDGGYPRPLAPTQWRQLASWETFDGMVCEFCTPKRRLHIFLVEGKGKFDGGIMAHRKALSNLLPQTSSAGLLQVIWRKSLQNEGVLSW